jgi:hypothetical protein
VAKYQSWCPNQILGMVPNRQSIVDGIVLPVPGKRIQFENGQYETNDEKEIEFIESNWLYGSKIVKVTAVKAKAGAGAGAGSGSEE